MPTQAGRIRVDRLAAMLPKWAWQKHSAGKGSRGLRMYSWARIALQAEDDEDTGHHHLLIRRNDTTGELAYLRCCSPTPVTLHTLVTVAGQRWRVEESFQSAKGLTGLDQHQVRRWNSWHRWTTLAMLAFAFLAVATASERDPKSTPDGLIALTVNEFRHRFNALLLTAKHTITSLLAWSRWRRQHQHRWIMHWLAGLVADCAPVAPPCPRLAVDSHDPARLRVAHPLRNQPNKPLLLLHDHHTASGLAPSSHRNLHIASVLRRSLESAS
jgi:hypothetical protein